MQWATSNIKYSPRLNELYTPYKEGYSIRPFYKGTGRFIATRGRGKNGYTKNKMFYSVEEARKWLDSLPEFPIKEHQYGREWMNDYEFKFGRYVKKK